VALWLAAVGCGDPFDDWASISCDDNSNVLRGATFARERDYFAVYRDFNGIALPSGEPSTQLSVLGTSGEPCKAASDHGACMRELDAASKLRNACAKEQRCGVFAVVNVGDDVTLIEERAEFVAWLAPVETLSDALAVSTWDEKTVFCPSSDERGTRFELDGATFKLATELDNCGVQKERVSWEVRGDGAVSGTEIEKLGESRCAI
jgi:hypothetical protein